MASFEREKEIVGFQEADIVRIVEIVKSGATWILKYLSEKYSSIQFLEAIDEDENTLLHIASRCTSIQMVKFLVILNDGLIEKTNKFGNRPQHYSAYFGYHDIYTFLDLFQKKSLNKNGYSPADIHPLKIADFFEANSAFILGSSTNLQRIGNLRSHCFHVLTVLLPLQLPEFLSPDEKSSFYMFLKEKIFNEFDSYRNDFIPRSLLNSSLLKIVKSYLKDKNGYKTWTGLNTFIGQLLYLVMQIVFCYQFTSLEYLGENVYDYENFIDFQLNSIQSDLQYYELFFGTTLRYLNPKTYQTYGFTEIIDAMINSVNFFWIGDGNLTTLRDTVAAKSAQIFNFNLKGIGPFNNLSLNDHQVSDIMNVTTTDEPRKRKFHSPEGSSISSTILSDLIENVEINDYEYLQELVKLFPELQHYRYLIDITPEKTGQALKVNYNLVNIVFGNFEGSKLAPNIVKEVNKTFLRLIYLRDILRGDRSKFPTLHKGFNDFYSFIQPAVVLEEQLYYLLFSIVADDLGRTKPFVDEISEFEKRTDAKRYVHDSCLAKVLSVFHGTAKLEELLPSFACLSPTYQQLYRQQVCNSLNLGAFVQGESPAYSLYDFCHSCPLIYQRRSRLIVQILGFSSFTYDGDTYESTIFTEMHCQMYLHAAKALIEKDFPIKDLSLQYQYCNNIYWKYIVHRANFVTPIPLLTIETLTPTQRALYRIVALARLSTAEAWETLLMIWMKFEAMGIAEKYTFYLNHTGFEEATAIYIVYAPAILDNTRKACGGSVAKGLWYGLQMLLRIYEETWKKLKEGMMEAERKTDNVGGFYMKHASTIAESMSSFDETKNIENFVRFDN